MEEEEEDEKEKGPRARVLEMDFQALIPNLL